MNPQPVHESSMPPREYRTPYDIENSSNTIYTPERIPRRQEEAKDQENTSNSTACAAR